MTSTYTPGVCNIGPAERRKRLRLGWVGSAIAAVMLVAFVVLQVPDVLRAAVAIPVGLSANGFLQSAMHFCVGFSMRGLYNMGPSLGTEEDVMDAQMRLADRRKGLQIITYSMFIAAAAVIVAVLLP
jgi:hypothetical protein